MDDSAFAAKADKVLEALAVHIEDELDLDVEAHGGMLTITLDDGGQYVINKHGVMKQIWLSSPRSGAWHFAYDAGSDEWRATKDAAVTLTSLLYGELGI